MQQLTLGLHANSIVHSVLCGQKEAFHRQTGVDVMSRHLCSQDVALHHQLQEGAALGHETSRNCQECRTRAKQEAAGTLAPTSVMLKGLGLTATWRARRCPGPPVTLETKAIVRNLLGFELSKQRQAVWPKREAKGE